ncbi:peptidase S8 family protein [Rhizoctonia solani 123E]|uniref:Peptidase S8 family protein n=1 Tax=Rhizoctonia solani 123E TaxID=1423351 RepID=A0A074RR05_9AGAM|nr:peptidase S8 family protein [Rhizoctonia solani 123E]
MSTRMVVTRAEVSEDAIPDTYLVMLKDDGNREAQINWVQNEHKCDATTFKCKILYEYRLTVGYTAKLCQVTLDYLSNHQDTKSIDEDRQPTWGIPQRERVMRNIAKQDTVYPDVPIQPLPVPLPIAVAASMGPKRKEWPNAPWGLQRLSQYLPLPKNSDPSLQKYVYKCGDPSKGGSVQRVDVYVLDSGVMTTHEQFGGRATFGKDFSKEHSSPEDPVTNDEDPVTDGHGTHVAGILGGKDVGVSRDVHIISVKVLGGMRGTLPVFQAIDWVIEQAKISKNPSIINMSFVFSGPGLEPLDNQVKRAVACNVHVVAAAGNYNADAQNLCPARVGGIMTVGATTIQDQRWISHDHAEIGSNFGDCVGIFAPGADIMSAGIRNNEQLVLKSGTSMAAPHVTGLIAYLIRTNGDKEPARMIKDICNTAYKLDRKLANIPAGTVNLLAFNGVV